MQSLKPTSSMVRPLRRAAWIRLGAALMTLLVTIAACSTAPTAPTLTELEQAQAAWASHNLTRYVYQYETQGFFNAFDGHLMRLVVIDDTVRSAQYVATNDTVPMATMLFPTIDGLFAQAIAAQKAGTLESITFDSTLSFPSRMKISGNPDASGVILASSIEFVP